MKQLDVKRWTLVGIEGESDGDGASKRQIAARSMAKNLKPLPAKRKRLSYSRIFTSDEYRQIAGGHIPKEMEDKWFVFVEDDKIYFHRSWTGFCIYEAELRPAGKICLLDSVWVNRDPSQNEETDDEFELEILSFLIDRLLLGKREWSLNPYELILNDEKIAKPYIEFNTADKMAAVFAGGGDVISASFETKGTEIKISNFKEAQDDRPENDLKALKTELLEKLGRATRFELSGAKLKFYQNDKLLLTFENKSFRRDNPRIYVDYSHWAQEFSIAITLTVEDDGDFSYDEDWSSYGARIGGRAEGVWWLSGETMFFRCDYASGNFIFQWSQGSTMTATEKPDCIDFGNDFTLSLVSQ